MFIIKAENLEELFGYIDELKKESNTEFVREYLDLQGITIFVNNKRCEAIIPEKKSL